MEHLIFAIFFSAILIFLVLSIIIPEYKNYYKVTGDVINYDSIMRKFVYKVSLTREDIINRLNTKNVMDELSCTFDFERSVVRFSEFGSYKEYYFYIEEYNGYSILKLEEVALIGIKSSVPIKLNPFMVKKLQAEIIPFSQHRF